MSDIQLGKSGKAGKISQNHIKGGVKKEQIKDKLLFNAVDKDGNGIIDSSELEIALNGLNPNNDDKITNKESKKFLKALKEQNIDLKKLKKEDILAFTLELAQATDNIEDSSVITDENGNKVIYITYKDGTKESIFPDNHREVETNDNGVTIKKVINKDNKLVSQTEITEDKTSQTQYAEDGTTPIETIENYHNSSAVKTIQYVEGKPKSAKLKVGITTENYTYDEEGKEILNSKIENEGIPTKEKRTEYVYEDGQTTTKTTEGEKTTTVVSRTDGSREEIVEENGQVKTNSVDASGTRTETQNDGTKTTTSSIDGKTTTRTENPDGTATEVTTDEYGNETTTKYNKNNKKISQTIVKDGITYKAEYDGNGNTYIVVQNGESPAAIAKKFRTSASTLLGMNKYQKDQLGNKYFMVGAKIKVPGEIAADDSRLTSRKDARGAKGDYVSSGAAAKEAAADKEVAERKKITWVEKKYKTFEEIARNLFKNEGIKNPSNMQISKRIKQLKEQNPDLKDGELLGKRIVAGVTKEKFAQIKEKEDKIKAKNEAIKKAAEETKLQKESAKQIVADLEKAIKGLNDNKAIKKALDRIDNPEEIAEVNRLLAAKGYKADDLYSSLEKFMYKELSESDIRYNSFDLLEEKVQKWISNGTLKADAAIKAQARMAARVICDGGDGLGTNCDTIKKGIHMIKAPAGADKSAAKAVYNEVNRIIKNHSTFYGLGAKSKNLLDYLHGEMWDGEIKYLKGILAQNDALQGADKAKAIKELTEEAVSGMGTDIEYLQQAIMAIKTPEEMASVEEELKKYCKAKGISPKLEGQGYLQAILYDECDTFCGVSTDHKEIRKFNEMLIKQGAYTPEQAAKIRAEGAVLQCINGNFNDIKDAISNIKDAATLKQFNALLSNKKLKTKYDNLDAFLNARYKNNQLNKDLIKAELAAKKLLSDTEAANIALRLIQNSDFNVRAKGLMAIRTNAQAEAIDRALEKKGTSLGEIYEQFNKEKENYKLKADIWDGIAVVGGVLGIGNIAEHISDKYRENTDVSNNLYVEAKKAQALTPEQKQAYELSVVDFEEKLNKLKEDYQAALDGQGVVSGAVNELFSVFNVGTTRDDIEARIAHDTETLRLLKLAAQGKLQKLVNGKAVNVSFEDVFKERQSEFVTANGASISAIKNKITGNTQTEFNAENVVKVKQQCDKLYAMDIAKDYILDSWSELNTALHSTDTKRLSIAICATLDKISQMTGQPMTLEGLGYKIKDKVIVDANGTPVDIENLKEVANTLKSGLSDISETLLGKAIPVNTSYDNVKKLLNNGYEEKLDEFKQEYKKAYGQEPPEDLVESYSKTISYGVMAANMAAIIGAAILAPITAGGSLAAFAPLIAGAASGTATLVMQGLEQSTDADGWTNKEWTESACDACWNAALTAIGMKVGTIAEKAATGGYKITATVIAKQQKLIKTLVPNISKTRLNAMSAILARAEATFGEVLSDVVQDLIQTYATEGHFNPETFALNLAASLGGNAAGHAFSAVGDIKAAKGSKVDAPRPDAPDSPNKPAKSVDDPKKFDGPDKPAKPVDDPKKLLDDPDTPTKPSEPRVKEPTNPGGKLGDDVVNDEVKAKILNDLGVEPGTRQAKLREEQIDAIACIIDKRTGQIMYSPEEISKILGNLKTEISPKTLHSLLNGRNCEVSIITEILDKVDTPEKVKALEALVEADKVKLVNGKYDISRKSYRLDPVDLQMLLLNGNPDLLTIKDVDEFIKKLIDMKITDYCTYSPNDSSLALQSILARVYNEHQCDAVLHFAKILKKNNIQADIYSFPREMIASEDDVLLYMHYANHNLLKPDNTLNNNVISMFNQLAEESGEVGKAQRRVLNALKKSSEDIEDICIAVNQIKNINPDVTILPSIAAAIEQNKKIPNDLSDLLNIRLDNEFQQDALFNLFSVDINRYEAITIMDMLEHVTDQKSYELFTDLVCRNYSPEVVIASLKKGQLDTTPLDIYRNKRMKDADKVGAALAKYHYRESSKIGKFAMQNPKRFMKMVDAGVFDLIEQGKISNKIIDNINEHTFLSNRTLDEIRRIKNNEPYIKTISGPEEISKVGDGRPCEINGRMYVNDNGVAIPLSLSKAKFEELFPPLESVTFKQGSSLGDCWLVSGFDNLMDSPGGRVALYKLFYQKGNDIYIKFPNETRDIKFPNGKVLSAKGRQIKGYANTVPPGIQMLEQAYAVRRYQKYDTSQMSTDIMAFSTDVKGLMEKVRGGNTSEVLETLFGPNLIIDTSIYNATSKRQIVEDIQKYANDENVVVFFGTKGQKDTFYLDEKYDIVENHSYAIKRYDPETNTLYITNPHHSEVLTEVPMSEFLKYATHLGYARIPRSIPVGAVDNAFKALAVHGIDGVTPPKAMTPKLKEDTMEYLRLLINDKNGDTFWEKWKPVIEEAIDNVPPKDYYRLLETVETFHKTNVMPIPEAVEALKNHEFEYINDLKKIFASTSNPDDVPLEDVISCFDNSRLEIIKKRLANDFPNGGCDVSFANYIASLKDVEFARVRAAGFIQKGIPYASSNNDINKVLEYIKSKYHGPNCYKQIDEMITKQCNMDPVQIKELCDGLMNVKAQSVLFDIAAHPDAKATNLHAVVKYADALQTMDNASRTFTGTSAFHILKKVNDDNFELLKDLLELQHIDLDSIDTVLTFCDTPAQIAKAREIAADIKAGKSTFVELGEFLNPKTTAQTPARPVDNATPAKAPEAENAAPKIADDSSLSPSESAPTTETSAKPTSTVGRLKRFANRILGRKEPVALDKLNEDDLINEFKTAWHDVQKHKGSDKYIQKYQAVCQEIEARGMDSGRIFHLAVTPDDMLRTELEMYMRHAGFENRIKEIEAEMKRRNMIAPDLDLVESYKSIHELKNKTGLDLDETQVVFADDATGKIAIKKPDAPFTTPILDSLDGIHPPKERTQELKDESIAHLRAFQKNGGASRYSGWTDETEAIIRKSLDNVAPEDYYRLMDAIKDYFALAIHFHDKNAIKYIMSKEGLDAYDKMRKIFSVNTPKNGNRIPLSYAMDRIPVEKADLMYTRLYSRRPSGGFSTSVVDIMDLNDVEFNRLISSGLFEKGVNYASDIEGLNRLFIKGKDALYNHVEYFKKFEDIIKNYCGNNPDKINEILAKLDKVDDVNLFKEIVSSKNENIDLDKILDNANLFARKLKKPHGFTDYKNTLLQITKDNAVLVDDLINLKGVKIEHVYNVLRYADTPARVHHIQTILDDIKVGKTDLLSLPFVKNAEVSTYVAQAKYAQTPKFPQGASLDEILTKTKQGQVVTVGNKTYINHLGKMEELQMSAETFEKLFPPYEANLLRQGEGTGDCYFISGGLISFQRNDYARASLYRMIKEEGDDIVITYPGYPNHPVRFSKGELTKGKFHLEKSAQGNLLLEQAYAKAKYAANHNVSNASKVDMDKAMEYIYGGNEHNVMNEIYGGNDATLLIRDRVKWDYENSLKSGEDFGKHEFVREENLNKLLDELSEKKNVLICGGTGAEEEGYLPDFGVTPHHAYCVEKIDNVNKTVTIVNPYNSLYSMTLTYDEFWSGFSTLSIKELPMA